MNIHEYSYRSTFSLIEFYDNNVKYYFVFAVYLLSIHIEKLIKSVQRHEILYCTTSKSYKNSVDSERWLATDGNIAENDRRQSQLLHDAVIFTVSLDNTNKIFADIGF